MAKNTINRELKLHSPAGVEPAVFFWPNSDHQKTKKGAVFIGGDEIVRTIRLVFEDFPEISQRNLDLDHCDIHSYANVKELCDKFNKIIDTHIKLNRGTEAFCTRLQQRATPKLFRHVLAQVYTRAVIDPEKLRNYEPFSPSVYGETSPDLIDSILQTLQLTEDQTFIDLGSGVGNVVLHAAALANCKHAYGIEREDTPATYALAMSDEFRSWMRWYGKQYSEFELEHGDFLTHPMIDERIKDADVIFVNNYVFGSTINHELKVKFMNMKDGAKIVSSREFCAETFRLNDRTKNDLGAVMHVTKPEEFFGKVSWSDKSVQYYLHVIDHSKLAFYYEKAHELHTKASNTHHSSSSTVKLDENHPPPNPHIKRKRPKDPLTSTRGRKLRPKHPSDQDSDLDSDPSPNDSNSTKRSRSSFKEYQSTLNELHNASEDFYHVNQNQPIQNERFNKSNLTKLSHENLHINHFPQCLFEQDDQRFLTSMNGYLEEFRERLIEYFYYMKSENYREQVKEQLSNEMELNQVLKAKVDCLEKNIKSLLHDAIHLLKMRTSELGIEELEKPIELITYASDISDKHKDLRTKIATLEKEIEDFNQDNDKMSLILTNFPKNDNLQSKLTIDINQTNQQSSILISPNSVEDKHVEANQKYNVVKSERKTDFIIQKRSKKTPVVSPIKIIKIPDASSASIDNLLSTKQLEPVQIHSAVLTKLHQQEQSLSSAVNVKGLIKTSSASNKKKDNSSAHSPRKKRDFYGKSPGPPSHSTKNRSSSTPACTETVPAAHLPSRPISIPPLKTPT